MEKWNLGYYIIQDMACGDCLNPRGKNVLKTCVHNKMASVFSLKGLTFLLNYFFRSQSIYKTVVP